MGKQKLNKKTVPIKIQIQENWKWVTILFACVSAGFWFGKYFTEMKLNAKIKELENQIQLQIIESETKNLKLMKEYINDIMDLKNEINKLQIKSYEHEKAGEKEN